MESHLLQMRGLKLKVKRLILYLAMSHLLQMRGLKLSILNKMKEKGCRIFYRCVD